MLFTEQNLNYGNAMSILDNAAYLNEAESMIHPQTIPVKEVSRLGYGVVRFDDVDSLAEAYGCDYIDAMYAIAESSDMNPEYLAVAVPEEDIIAYPEIVNELANIVVQPLSEYDFGYRYVDMCLEAWDNTGNEDYLEAIIDDSCLYEAAALLLEMTDSQYQALKNDSNIRPEIVDLLGKKYYGKDVSDEQLKADIAKYNPVSAESQQNHRTLSAPLPTTKPEKLDLSTDHMDDHDSIIAKQSSRGRLGRAWVSTKTAYKKAGTDFRNALNDNKGFTNKAKALGKAAWQNKAVVGGTAVAAGAAGYGVYRFAKYVKEARNKPKSWIGKKIAALRSIYQKWMQQAQKNPKKAGIIKSACAKLLSIIDALMAQLQRAAG